MAVSQSVRDIEQGDLERELRLEQPNTDGPPTSRPTNENHIHQSLNITDHPSTSGSTINEGFKTLNDNDNEQTRLHRAVRLKNKDAVEELLENGASVSCWDEKGQTPLHVCVENQLEDILKILVRREPNVQDFCGKTVLRAAVDAGWLQGVHVVLDASADVTIKATDGKSPLHSAIEKGRKDIIKLILKKEPNLAAEVPKDGSENSETVLEMIIHNMPTPTEFLKDIFNSYISFDTMNRVKVDYKILIPSKNLKEEMNVIEILLKTGNEYEQKNLLLHPLIESFIHLKWQAVRPYYFQIAGLHIIFITLLAIYILKVFYFKDIYKIKHEWYYLMAQGAAIYMCIIIIIIHEIFINYGKSSRMEYLLNRKNWAQIISLGLAITLPPALLKQEAEWPRHIATGALLFSCIQMLIILSQYPRWGFYVVMFGKVALNVIKILGTFAVLIIGFAFSFMIQFHSQAPFDGPWDAIVKTLFLLTSEFEYNDVFKPKNAEELGSSFQVVRLIFVAFLILVAIVLMNMMVGVAVDDIKDLKSYGDVGRLEKQVAFVSSLDTLEYNFTKKILHVSDENRPTNRYCRHLFPQIITFGKDNVTSDDICIIKKRFTKDFFSIAQDNKKKEEQQKIKHVETEVESKKAKTQHYADTMMRFDRLEEALDIKIELLKKYFLVKLRRISRKRNRFLLAARNFRLATSTKQLH